MPQLTKQQQFFYDNGGYAVGPNETREQGKTRSAIESAQAETWAVENGYSFTIAPDPDADESFMDYESAEYQAEWRGTAWYCLMHDENGATAQSLSGCFGDSKYERVVKAELAMEQKALSELPAKHY